MKRLMTLITATLFSAGVSAAHHGEADMADHSQQSSDLPSFSELDQNSDGVISQDEARGTPLEDRFASIDADNDGQIGEAEMTLESGEATAAGMQQSGAEKAQEDASSHEPQIPGAVGEHNPLPITE